MTWPLEEIKLANGTTIRSDHRHTIVTDWTWIYIRTPSGEGQQRIHVMGVLMTEKRSKPR